ncbi:MAG: Response regulator, partial [Vampirovibrio sp.]|nr:Response regulator [Vampirovibrio sp.]
MGKSNTILLVEDNRYDEELTIAAFEDNRLANNIVVTRDGEEALDYLFGTGIHEGRDTRELPELILLDLKLPKVDGLEVLKQIRANELTRFIPVVILTSSKEQEDRLQGYYYGCNAYIRKPVDFAQFGEAVRTLGLFWTVYNESAYDS